MLILSRKHNEFIDIVTPSGERISIVVTDIDRGKVRLGFEAAKQVAILRRELRTPEEPDGNAD